MKWSWTLAFILSLMATSSASVAQHQPRRFHLALLSISEPGNILPQVRGLKDGLQESGYLSGNNLTIHHLGNGSVAELRERLKQLLHQGVNVIVTTSAFETAIAQRITNKIPIVFAPSIDPVRMGFVKSRSHPDTNLTGLSFTRGPGDNAKQLALFKQIFPTLRRLTMLYDARPTYGLPSIVRDSIERVAQRRSIHLRQAGVISSADAVRVLERTPKGTTDGVFVICAALFRVMKPLAKATMSKGIPLFGCTTSQVADDGATMTYTPDLYLIGYRGAWYVDRLLKGAKPWQLPIESPSRLELAINLKNARSIGLNIPPEQLILADRVFQ